MAQTFFPITPTEITAGSANEFVTMDASALAPANTTGVILHIVNTNASAERNVGIRKNGSTDDRHPDQRRGSHCWAMIGVDASRYFEAYVESTTDIDIYVVGYTMAGVTFATNATEKSPDETGSWRTIDCSTEAPSAIGLIFEIENVSTAGGYQFGLKKNGSTDDRHYDNYFRSNIGAIIGCDASQIYEGYIEDTDLSFFLVGYITDGATFNTNATDVSLGSTGSFIDLTALPDVTPAPNMGFIEVAATTNPYNYGLRKDGSGEDIVLSTYYHPWGIVECASRIIEGEISDTSVDFFVVGYSTGAAEDTTVTPPTISLTLTEYAPSAIIGTILTPSKLGLALTAYAPPIIVGTRIIPSTLSLSITEYIPSIAISDNIKVTPGTLSLIISAYSPILKETITPSILSLILTEYAPSIIKGTIIIPPTLSLILTKYAPILIEGTVITPGKLGLTLTGYAPILKEVITPGKLSLILTEYAPDIIFGVIISGALGYTIEIRDSSGNLLAVLENAHGISLTEQLNLPPMLDFLLPADDGKLSHIDPDNEIWLRDYETGVLVKKFLLSRRRDMR